MDQRIIELIERVVTAEGFELVTCELMGGTKQKVLRVVVDHPQGITHDHCSYLSHQLGAHLDAANFIPSAYILEISSPGVERGLYRVRDFQRFAGSTLRVRTRTPIDGRRNFHGILKGTRDRQAEEGSVLSEDPYVVLEIKGANEHQEVEIPFSIIDKANLEISLSELFRVAEEKRKSHS